ncbi:MAG: nucleotidyltransferase domain-containing protein [Candidatus Latescibacterota bacterium]
MALRLNGSIFSDKTFSLTIVPILSTIVPIMSTSDDKNSLANTLFGETRLAVLTLLYGRPDRLLYLRQIVRMTGAGQGAVQRELKLLSDAGIIERSRTGNHVFFRANSRCPIFDELRGIIIKTAGLADVLRDALDPIAGNIRSAFVYGSYADGRDTPASDIDVMVIGNVSFGEVVRTLQSAQEILSREINPSVYPEGEFIRKVSDRNAFLERVLDGGKIFLIGDEDELGRLAQEPPTHGQAAGIPSEIE